MSEEINEDRFNWLMQRIEMIPETGCWLWTGCTTCAGYGQIRHDRQMVYVHRLLYEHFKGPIPKGFFLDHHCRVRRCCNPEHVRPVTPRINTLENSLSPTALHAQKACCPKCGGPYSELIRSTRSQRRCRPCHAAYERRYRAAKKAERILTAA